MKFLTLIFTLTFFIQSSAWAFGGISNEQKEQLNFIISHYNSMTRTGRLKLIQNFMGLRSAEDKEYFEKNIKYFEGMNLPNIETKGNEISFIVEDIKIKMNLLADYKVMIQDEIIDVAPGKLDQASEKMHQLMMKNKISFFNIFINSAHANSKEESNAKLFSLLAGFCAGIIMFASWISGFGLIIVSTATGIYHIKKKIDKEIAKMCSDLDREVKNLTEGELPEFLNHLETANKQIADTAQCKLIIVEKLACTKIKACLEKASSDLKSLKWMNQDERAKIKESTPVSSPTQNKASSKQ